MNVKGVISLRWAEAATVGTSLYILRGGEIGVLALPLEGEGEHTKLLPKTRRACSKYEKTRKGTQCPSFHYSGTQYPPKYRIPTPQLNKTKSDCQGCQGRKKEKSLILLCHLLGLVCPPDHLDPWEDPLPGPPLLLYRVAGGGRGLLSAVAERGRTPDAPGPHMGRGVLSVGL